MFRQALPEPRCPLPLLITGVAGVAGYNALAYFQARYPGQVIGIRQRDNWRLDGPGIVACNAEDRARPGSDCSTSTNSQPCSIAPATAHSRPASSIR